MSKLVLDAGVAGGWFAVAGADGALLDVDDVGFIMEV
jgi:hypothetical protein